MKKVFEVITTDTISGEQISWHFDSKKAANTWKEIAQGAGEVRIVERRVYNFKDIL